MIYLRVICPSYYGQLSTCWCKVTFKWHFPHLVHMVKWSENQLEIVFSPLCPELKIEAVSRWDPLYVQTPYMDGCADSMIAMLVPKAPPKHISSRDGEIEDEDEDLVSALTEGFFDTCLYKVAVSELAIDRNCWRPIHCEGAIIFQLATVQRFKLQDSATPLQRRLARFMREKLRVPGK